jgi:AraC-like DNA-binding protein
MEDQQKKLVTALLGYCVQREYSPETLCHLAQISPEQLKNRDHPLSEKQVNDLWSNIIHLSKDSLFGAHLGESLQLSALGIVGEIIKTSDTVGQALTFAGSLTPLITHAFEMVITTHDYTFDVDFKPTIDNWERVTAVKQTLDVLMVFVIHELDGLTMSRIIPLSVNYAQEIENVEEYGRVMRCKPTMNTGHNRITFDIKYWNNPIITANYEFQKFLLQKREQLMPPTSGGKSFKNRIYNYLTANSYLGFPSLEDIASNFNTSPRTLQRKLKEEGMNFQQLVDEAKKTLAISYLQAGSYPVKEISYMLGYNELSAFTRSFKRWTGYPPGTYQKNYS